MKTGMIDMQAGKLFAAGFLVFGITATGSSALATTVPNEADQIAQAKTQEPAKTPGLKVVFEDDFKEDTLAPHWQVRNPNPDEFLVEDGKLLMIANDRGGFLNPKNTNLLSLDTKFPKKDWVMKATVKGEFATVKEEIWVGALRDEKNFLAARLYTSGNPSFGWKLVLRVEKRSNGKASHFEQIVKRMHCNVCKAGKRFPDFAATVAAPIEISLVRQGRRVFARAAIKGEVGKDGKPVIVQTQPVSALRVSGSPALTVSQWDKTNGETMFQTERVEILAPE